MNMTKKRSPRKKRFEYCRHLCFETWFITFTITIFILLSSRCSAAVSVLNITDSDIPSETSSREDTNGNYSSNYTNLIENTSFGYARVDERSGNDTLVNGSNPVTFPATVSTVYAIEHKKAPNEGIPLVIKATRVNNNDIIIFNKTKTIAKPSGNFKNKTDGAAAYKKSNGSQPHKYKSSTRVPKLKNSHHGVNNNEVNSDEYYLSDFDRNVKGDKVYFGDVKNHDFRNMNGKNKSVTKNKSVKNKTSAKNRTHAAVGGVVVKSEDEVEEYETKLADDKDEYDRTTKKTITPEEEADTGALGVLQKLAEGVLESLAERLLPAGLRDIFRRVQDQNIALETLRLRSREENGGLGIFGRSLLKGLADPLNSWMQGGSKDNGSLDSDRGFLNGVLSGVADSVGDAFKIRVTAIYPGTLWCGDGHLAHTQSAEVGLFFKTDSCCRLHDSCRLYILAGQSDYGLTNTGLFTRSHCSCDSAFYRCLRRTNSLVSSQIGATYFSILGPQCFKREHPIVKCTRRTRITGQKCEEYELDKSQPKIWQWFDSPTF